VFHTWVSIRQAFLDLDKDHDGFIEAKDFLFVFGDNQLDFVYLKKLMNDLTK
jgi:Ca2+-binding EF-hand superfamily protein